MRAREMHPLCCILIDSPRVGDRSPAPELYGVVEGEASSSTVAVAGVLYKWTNFGKGWRSRWFSLRNGVLSYSKIPRGEEVCFSEGGGVRLIGTAASRLSRPNASGGGRNPPKPVGVIYLKVSECRKMVRIDSFVYFWCNLVSRGGSFLIFLEMLTKIGGD